MTTTFEELRRIVPPRLKPAPTPTPANDKHAAAGDDNRVKRCSAYIDKMSGAISGQHGHDQTFTVACELFRFGLDESDAWALLCDYNRRCQPKWSEKELKHKLTLQRYNRFGKERSRESLAALLRAW